METKRLWLGTALVFVLAFFVFAFLFLRMAMLVDSDSYYHLAVARHYAEHGIGAVVPWPRFSLLAGGGDKELLFHVLLMPFASWMDAPTGGRIALALINAGLMAAVANLAARAIGPWGLAVPVWLWIAAPPFFARAVRLRPELIALLLILIAIAVVKRPIALGVVAAIFAWSYTAWHVFLAICVVWAWLDRRWKSIAFAAAGTAIGLFVRPHPIENLRIWFVQNFQFFAAKHALDVGDEIGAPDLVQVAVVAIGWWLVVVAALAYRRRGGGGSTENLKYVLVPAVLFAILFLFMGRMATYAFPLITLAVLHYAPIRGVAVPIALALGIVIGLPAAGNRTLMQLLRGNVVTEAELEAFGRAVPRGARVAATWGDGELYAFWAPQARYLNVLDPIFMALPYPREFGAQRRIFDGTEPDPAHVAKTLLASDFLAFDFTAAPRTFVERVRSDPRFRPRYTGYNVLLQIVESHRFAMDWQGAAMPPQPFVRADTKNCTTVSRAATPGSYVFAPYGAATLSIDGRPAAQAPQPPLAIIGRGARVDVPAGAKRLEVRTCPAGEFNGFYFVRLN